MFHFKKSYVIRLISRVVHLPTVPSAMTTMFQNKEGNEKISKLLQVFHNIFLVHWQPQDFCAG